MEKFQTVVSGSVYDIVDLSTQIPRQKKTELEILNSDISKLEHGIEKLKLKFKQPVEIDQPLAELSLENAAKAEFLKKCLSVCPRMTAVQLNTEGRLVCGGVVLKQGDTAENIQANWDLIDTCTGADS